MTTPCSKCFSIEVIAAEPCHEFAEAVWEFFKEGETAVGGASVSATAVVGSSGSFDSSAVADATEGYGSVRSIIRAFICNNTDDPITIRVNVDYSALADGASTGTGGNVAWALVNKVNASGGYDIFPYYGAFVLDGTGPVGASESLDFDYVIDPHDSRYIGFSTVVVANAVCDAPGPKLTSSATMTGTFLAEII